MKKFFPHLNVYASRQGSSLLVAMLVMAVLLTLTLGLSSLVIREISQTGDVVAAGKAYFAAEAGVENALLDLNQHLPGYQTKGLPGVVNDEWVPVKDDAIDYQYRIRNKGDSYPYFDADKPIYLTPGVGVTKDFLYNSGTDEALRATYNVLPLNGTVTIPLFTDCGDGTYSDVKDFLLEYFVDFDLDPALDIPTYGQLATKLEDFDVLRWKVFGEPVVPDITGGPSRTHAISDFYPAKTNDSPENPVCIGTDMGLGEGCQFPAAKFVKNDAEYISNYSDPASQGVIEDIANAWSLARQCYLSDVGSAVAATDIQKGCSIKTFIDNHKKNYLTITNIVNPGIIGISNPLLRAQRANIYYRVVARGDAGSACSGQPQNSQDVMVREYADISSDGFTSDGKVKQSIDVQLKLNSFLPVFSFSLYNADPAKTGNEPDVSALPFGLGGLGLSL